MTKTSLDVALDIYKIFRKNINIAVKSGKRPKSANQYKPHLGFGKYPAGIDFEATFPSLIVEGDFATLRQEIKNQTKLIAILGIKQKSAKTYCATFLAFLNYLIKTSNKKDNSILIAIKNVYQIDGITPLITLLGGLDAFVKKSLESSYFFDSGLAINRNIYIDETFKNNPKDLYVRHSENEDTQRLYKNCKVDPDGNYAVRKLIKTDENTGYIVSGGKKSIIVNYKISHI